MKKLLLCVPVRLKGICGPELEATMAEHEETECPICGQAMLLGHRGKILVEKNETDILCMQCAIALGLANKDSKLQHLSDGDN